jgi:hypothetical protein
MKRLPEKVGSRFPPLKPINISDADAEMLRRHDYVGLDYLQCSALRWKKNKSADEVRRLAEHDAQEKLINLDPKAALTQARKAIDDGTSLLLKLIRSQKFTHVMEPTKKGRVAGVKARRWDEAFNCFESRISYLNLQLVRLAEENSPQACRSLWFQAVTLAEAFTRLALVHRDEFRDVAEQSLTMPSLRTRNPKFTADTFAIVEAIGLGEKHPTPDVWDNRSRVGAMCHVVVAKIIDEIHHARREYNWEKETLVMMKAFSETAEEYRDATLEQVLRNRMPQARYDHLFACANLPDWPQDPADLPKSPTSRRRSKSNGIAGAPRKL